MSQVYFVRALKTGFIKIGYSTAPAKRVSDMQVGTGEPLSLILTVPGNRAEERAFHMRFNDSRERGEWFREDGQLLKFLKAKKLDLISSNAAAEVLSGNVLKRGFCRTKEELDRLYAIGLADKEIYMAGRGGENILYCIDAFRGRPGRIFLASDLRAFGDKKPEIKAAMNYIEAAGLRVTDITHKEDNTHLKLLDRGLKSAANYRFARNSRLARRVGSAGGKGKGLSGWRERDEIAPQWLIERLVAELGAKRTAALLDNKISASTLDRRYRGHAAA